MSLYKPPMNASERFAKRVFFSAGIYGLVVLAPMYLLEERIGRESPPAITHPEHFYGFIGVALAWQFAFLVIAREPTRFRPVMLAAVAEKFSFGASTFVLLVASRVPPLVAVFAAIDVCLGVLFLVSFFRLRPSPPM